MDHGSTELHTSRAEAPSPCVKPSEACLPSCIEMTPWPPFLLHTLLTYIAYVPRRQTCRKYCTHNSTRLYHSIASSLSTSNRTCVSWLDLRKLLFIMYSPTVSQTYRDRSFDFSLTIFVRPTWPSFSVFLTFSVLFSTSKRIKMVKREHIEFRIQIQASRCTN